MNEPFPAQVEETLIADPAPFPVGAWAYSPAHGEPVRILEVETAWAHTVYQVWIPRLATVERLPAAALTSAPPPQTHLPDRIAYAAAAARVADALTQDVLLAPLEAGVIPLPHQLYALTRAVTGDRVRYLLADEVGLGKTIEAGLICRELKLRGLVRRVLVIAPKGLVAQWVQEMRTHFNEDFRLLIPGEFSALRALTGDENVWRQFDQVVCPLDSIKPLERRRGWSPEQLETWNQERLGDLIDADWDLIICDEAHRLGGSTDQVARYRLGKALADAAPYLLLLSATPHQGKTDSFQRLMTLLDREQFIAANAIQREQVAPWVIRTEKRRAINDRGEPLFHPRLTRLLPVCWEEKHQLQKQLYEAVTDYVRVGYNQAIQQKRHYLGFLMILMQRLVTSSTQAIASALARRLAVLRELQGAPTAEDSTDNDQEEVDSQERLDELLSARLAGLQNEQTEVEFLLELARRCQAQGPDARAETLLDLLYTTQQAENDPELKFLIFTEFVPTQTMLREFLTQHGFSVVVLNGSMTLEERRQVQQQFAEEVRILVSTDAGGEGLNLQFCHIAINYDLPWNPMRIEQRIGRVDRIGQQALVKAFNLIFADSVELRIQEVLEEKLATILHEFGVDKTEDVLDSAESGALFEKLYVETLLNPDDLENQIDRTLHEVREQAGQARAGRSFYGETILDPTLAQQLSGHPLPYWLERMTTAYLRSAGGQVQRDLFGYTLDWPDGSRMAGVVFDSRLARVRGLPHVNLEDARIRRLVQQLPRVLVADAIPGLRLASLPTEVAGYWSLWQISLGPASLRERRILPLFHHDDGRLLIPTARHIWDVLLEERPAAQWMASQTGPAVAAVYHRLRADAEQRGAAAFHELLARHQQRLQQEQIKRQAAFQARREALDRLGLPEVRHYRLKRLAEEEAVWVAEWQKRQAILPELHPILILRVEAAPPPQPSPTREGSPLMAAGHDHLAG